jgi:electron transport complex protein RnfG
MKDIVKLVVVLTLIAAGAGLLLSMVEQITWAPISEQRRQETLKALLAVLPPSDNSPDVDTVTLVTGLDNKGRDLQRVFYRGRRHGDLAGVAFKVVAPDGYSGSIEIMVGVDLEGIVTGIEILAQTETPGLGSKIKQARFKRQFLGKSLDNADWRVKKDGGVFDQLTGATISPRAVVAAVAEGLKFYRENRARVVAVGGEPR